MNSDGHPQLPLDVELNLVCASCGKPWSEADEVVYRNGQLEHVDCSPEKRAARSRLRFLEQLLSRATSQELQAAIQILLGDANRETWTPAKERAWERLRQRRIADFGNHDRPDTTKADHRNARRRPSPSYSGYPGAGSVFVPQPAPRACVRLPVGCSA